MKKIKILSVLFAGIFCMQFSYAQAVVKKESLHVYGNCGMCKKTIESSAKNAGATYANWNTKSKKLDISYNPLVTGSVKIQEAIANSGYDTQDFRASDSAYNQLHECCKYERKQIEQSKNN